MSDRIIPPGHTEDQLMVDTARALALWLHRDQVDKQGVPYFAHLSRVAQRVKGWGGTPGQIAAAWLHDAVEDTPLSEEAIGEIFGPEIDTMVRWLTRRPGEGETHARWIERMVSFEPARPILLVKLADLKDNLSRLAGLSDNDRARLEPRYRDAHAEILKALGEDAPAPLVEIEATP